MGQPWVRAVGEHCPDCLVWQGQPHRDGCDVARCWLTGRQRLMCDESHDCGRDAWTGLWPGVLDCIRIGWYARLQGGRWVPCSSVDPGAGPDLNRLVREGVYDPGTRRWYASA